MDKKKRRRRPDPHWSPSIADFIKEKDTSKLLQFRKSLPEKSTLEKTLLKNEDPASR